MRLQEERGRLECEHVEMTEKLDELRRESEAERRRHSLELQKLRREVNDSRTELSAAAVPAVTSEDLGHPGGSWYTANRDHALALATKNQGKTKKAGKKSRKTPQNMFFPHVLLFVVMFCY